MKTIYINGRFLTQSLTGVQRYCIEVVQELDKLQQSEIQYVLLVPKKGNRIIAKLNLTKIEIKYIGFFTGHFWEQIDLFYFTLFKGLFSPSGIGPIFKINHIPTFHDVNFLDFPKGFTNLFVFWYTTLFTISGKISKKIITVSEYSKGRIQLRLRIKSKKIVPIYEGSQHMERVLSSTKISKRISAHIPYILAVSSLNKNKNFDLIIDSLDGILNLGFQLIIVGGTNSEIFKKNEKYKSGKGITFVGRVSDEELKSLYEKAFCFVYPSFCEGFGLPPLEAQNCGTFCIISNTSCLPEIYGNSVLYCDPYDYKSLINSIQQLSSNIHLREQLSQRMSINVAKYTWEKCAYQLHLEIKETLCK